MAVFFVSQSVACGQEASPAAEYFGHLENVNQNASEAGRMILDKAARLASASSREGAERLWRSMLSDGSTLYDEVSSDLTSLVPPEEAATAHAQLVSLTGQLRDAFARAQLKADDSLDGGAVWLSSELEWISAQLESVCAELQSTARTAGITADLDCGQSLNQR